MKPTVTVLASGLNLLSFQGVTIFADAIIVATVEADLVRVEFDGSLTPWVNVAKYGIPTGIVGMKESILIALSAQEVGHFLIRVTKQGKQFLFSDLSDLAGDFGAPFAVAAHEGYYPWYVVALSTDVLRSKGLIARVNRLGKATVLTTLASTPFGMGLAEDYAIATQQNGEIVKVTLSGKIEAIANLEQAGFGIPLDLTRLQEDWIITTTTGWLVALKLDGSLFPLMNLSEINQGLPTTLTTFNSQLIVLTQTGNLLQIAV